MIKTHKKTILITAFLTILPMVAGLILWNRLPEQLTTHWNLSCEADGWSSKGFVVFGLPLIMLALYGICVMATGFDHKNKNQSGKVFTLVLWIMPVISIMSCAMVYLDALGIHVDMILWLRGYLGLLLLIIGNYLPKCKPNHTIGVRVKWTLENDENWRATHRFAGVVWVIGGIIVLLSMLISVPGIGVAMTVFALLCVFAPIVYSYCYDQKGMKNHER